uniref:DUF4330 domain-containing protein n=1 Tax=Trichocoleus desertorum TaxID=1481672 RepID=UPI0025B60B13|nr:DUF4330 domain-containing protein [Trichocoleus desertorum]
MAILDSQGRLFGKVSILDVGAALVILLVVIGIFLVPGTGSVAQINNATKPIEVDLIAKGLSVSNPQRFIQDFQSAKKTSLVIRNQPYGEVDLKSVQVLPRNVLITQPDGSVKVIPDPRSEMSYSTDLLITVGGRAQINEDGPVLGNSKIKIGSVVQLQGTLYDFNASVVDIRLNNN